MKALTTGRGSIWQLLVVLTASVGLAGIAAAQAPDADGDGIPDAQDNCTQVANPDQQDADGDGFGNMCDADLNNDGMTNEADFALLQSVLNKDASSSPLAVAADMDGDGRVTAKDFNRLRARMNAAPGPSALVP